LDRREFDVSAALLELWTVHPERSEWLKQADEAVAEAEQLGEKQAWNNAIGALHAARAWLQRAGEWRDRARALLEDAWRVREWVRIARDLLSRPEEKAFYDQCDEMLTQVEYAILTGDWEQSELLLAQVGQRLPRIEDAIGERRAAISEQACAASTLGPLSAEDLDWIEQRRLAADDALRVGQPDVALVLYREAAELSAEVALAAQEVAAVLAQADTVTGTPTEDGDAAEERADAPTGDTIPQTANTTPATDSTSNTSEPRTRHSEPDPASIDIDPRYPPYPTGAMTGKATVGPPVPEEVPQAEKVAANPEPTHEPEVVKEGDGNGIMNAADVRPVSPPTEGDTSRKADRDSEADKNREPTALVPAIRPVPGAEPRPEPEPDKPALPVNVSDAPRATFPMEAERAREVQRKTAQSLGLETHRRISAAGVEFDLVLVPPGEFMMGSPNYEAGRYSDEGPRLVTRVPKALYVGEFEVTVAQWRAIMGEDRGDAGHDRLPVVSVSWRDCQAFCHKLSELTGMTVRLPTETEWEYACRAGTDAPYSFGLSLTADQAAFDYSFATVPGGQKAKSAREVGHYPANAWGLHDMHGNVWEWCQDVYGPYGDGASSPPGPEMRVLRGGAWTCSPTFCRSAARVRTQPDASSEDAGFRIVVELP
jgi:formylglycine-generating enzyme required for sulfatase activity